MLSIRSVQSPEELEAAVRFLGELAPGTFERSGRGLDFYGERFRDERPLYLLAEDDAGVVGAILGYLSGSGVTVGEYGVAPSYGVEGLLERLLHDFGTAVYQVDRPSYMIPADASEAVFLEELGFAPRHLLSVLRDRSEPRSEGGAAPGTQRHEALICRGIRRSRQRRSDRGPGGSTPPCPAERGAAGDPREWVSHESLG